MLIEFRQRGFSLVELMIAIVIVSILLLVGMPTFSLWLQNSQVRASAESIQNGLQSARNEAVKRNTQVRFNLSNTAAGLIVWTIDCVNINASCQSPSGTGVLQQNSLGEGGSNARVGASNAIILLPVPAGYYSTALVAGVGLPAAITFDGLGKQTGAGNITRIDITNAVNAAARRLVVYISASGQIRMCDPLLSAAVNAQGCPP